MPLTSAVSFTALMPTVSKNNIVISGKETIKKLRRKNQLPFMIKEYATIRFAAFPQAFEVNILKMHALK
jgi:hypothetical protein